MFFTIDIANVAHISPVPVLNCEILNGPETYSEGVLVLTGKSEQSLKLVSKAAESSPNICSLRSEGSAVFRRIFGFLFLNDSFHHKPENFWKMTDNALAFCRQFASTEFTVRTLHCMTLGESEVIIKHLITVVRRYAALFTLFGFWMLQKHDRNFYIFL